MKNTIKAIQATSLTYVGSRNALMYLFDKFEEKGTLDVEDFTKAEKMCKEHYDYAIDKVLVIPREKRGYRNFIVKEYTPKQEKNNENCL